MVEEPDVESAERIVAYDIDMSGRDLEVRSSGDRVSNIFDCQPAGRVFRIASRKGASPHTMATLWFSSDTGPGGSRCDPR
jgi:hypothetical protein